MEVKISAVVSVPVEARFPVLASKVLAAFKVACSVGFRAVCWEPPQLLLVLLGVFIENINTPIACDTEKHILPIHAAEQCL